MIRRTVIILVAVPFQAVAADLGVPGMLRLHADSAAAIGICNRSGIGRARHLAVGQLWVQERISSGEVRLFNVLGKSNPADILTKAIPRPQHQRLRAQIMSDILSYVGDDLLVQVTYCRAMLDTLTL